MAVDNTQQYRINIDSALLAFSVLCKLGAGKVDTFANRLKSQKIQYLAQVFGVSPAYNFSLYIHGPYSPGLAHDLFAFNGTKQSPDMSDFVPDVLKKRFKALSEFVKGKGNRHLELVTTLHFLKKLFYSDEAASRKLVEIKNASLEEIKMSFAELKKIL